jgi:hypothetical protein
VNVSDGAGREAVRVIWKNFLAVEIMLYLEYL